VSAETCECECAGSKECPSLTKSDSPGMTVYDESTCSCVCPLDSPSVEHCESMNQVWRDCGCECAEECAVGEVQNMWCECEAKHCCLTMKLEYTPWAGICWKETTESGCAADPYRRCVWDERFCLPSPPFNSLDYTRACKFVDDACTEHAECCSEFCVVTAGVGKCM